MPELTGATERIIQAFFLLARLGIIVGYLWYVTYGPNGYFTKTQEGKQPSWGGYIGWLCLGLFLIGAISVLAGDVNLEVAKGFFNGVMNYFRSGTVSSSVPAPTAVTPIQTPIPTP